MGNKETVSGATTRSNRAKFLELESIRGIAALLVVVYHSPKWNPDLLDVGIVRNGYLMVDLFFVLSGFVIYNTYATSIRNVQQLWRFQFLRFGRLYPIHLLFLLFFLGVEALKYLAQVKLGAVSGNTVPFRENNLTAFIQQLFLIHAVGPTGNEQTFNIPSWSISVEFYVYLVFGTVVLFARSRRSLVCGALFLASLTLLIADTTFGFTDFLKGTTGFFLGCLTAVLSERVVTRVPASLPLLASTTLIVFLQIKQQPEQDVLIYFCSALLILGLVRSQDGMVKKVLRWPALVWIGTISYSIYMSHAAVLWIFNQLVRSVFLRNGFSGVVSTPRLSTELTIVVYAALVVTVLIVSQLTYVWVEKPLREKSRQLALGRTTQSGGEEPRLLSS